MRGLVVHGTQHLAVAVTPTRVVPGLDSFEDGLSQLLAALPVILVEQLELEGAEEALGHAVEQSPIDPMEPSRPAPRSRRPKAHEV